MKIKWFGHACFLIASDSGVRILTDPFDETVGYSMPEEEADIVAISHNHFDHNHIDAVKGNFKVIDSPGQFTEKGIQVAGVHTYHDKAAGSKRGENVVFNFKIDGLNICHCGDLGHILTEKQVKETGNVDVLLVPVGGTFTVNADEAYEIVKQLKPKVTIPMHFKTDVLDFPIDGVSRFLSVTGGGESAGKQEIELNKDNICEFSKVVVLDYN